MAARTHSRLGPALLWGVVALLLGVIALPYLREALRPPLDGRAIFAEGVMRVGLDPSRPPFAFFNENGDYVGLEIDLAQAIADELDVELQFIPLGFDGLYDALQTNQADLVIAGLQPDFNQMRQGVVYSRHYFDAGLVLASRGEAASMRDLPGKALAYEFGSPADALAHRWLRRVLPYELRPYEQPSYAMQAVHYGEADAALVGMTTARLYLRQHPGLSLQLEPVTHAWYSITVREGREDVLAAINTTLNTLDETGTLGRILATWL